MREEEKKRYKMQQPTSSKRSLRHTTLLFSSLSRASHSLRLSRSQSWETHTHVYPHTGNSFAAHVVVAVVVVVAAAATKKTHDGFDYDDIGWCDENVEEKETENDDDDEQTHRCSCQL